MATPILMPKQGNSVEECIIVAWNKKVGENVTEGDVIAEIETDKASFVVEAPATGEVLGYFYGEGELAPVLVNIGVIGEKGEDIEQFRPVIEEVASAKPAPTAAPVAQSSAPVASVATGELSVAPVAPVAVSVVAPAAPTLSPRAKKYAARFNVDTSNITGSGVHGRISESDVIRARFTGTQRTDLATKMLADGWELRPTAKGGSIRSTDLRKGEEQSNVRKVIASRMAGSLKDHAQLTLNGSADATNLLAARGRLKAGAGEAGYVNITVGDLILFAVIKALEEMPEINCEFINGKVYRSEEVNIAFACDTDKGLLVPVIAGSEELTLKELSQKVKERAFAAMDGTINPDYLEGGSFTVSNLGAFGIETFTPVLNAPQVAILGVCSPVLRPVRENGEVVFKDFIGLSLTIDHQVIDGAPGAKFLQKVKANIENIGELAGI